MTNKAYLNWPFFDESHKELAQSLDQWAEKELSPIEEQGEATNNDELDAQCAQILAKLASANWLDNAVPNHEGKDAKHDVRSICLSREILAYHSGLADFTFAMQGLGSGAIALFGNNEQKQTYLTAARSGKMVAAFALSEPDAGSDVAALATTATETDGSFILNGEKTFISNGGIADFYCVFARTPNSSGAKGISAFIVDKDNAGLEIESRIDLIAPHPLAHIKFNNCEIPKENLIGDIGEGFKIAMATLDIFRSTVGAASMGFAKRGLTEAINHTKNRKAFGGTISDLQLTQASLAEMALDIDASSLLIYRAAWLKDMGQDRITSEAAMAKLYATETASKTIDKAVQLHGGLGVVSGQMVEKLYREVRALRIYEGASEVQKLIIAKQLLN